MIQTPGAFQQIVALYGLRSGGLGPFYQILDNPDKNFRIFFLKKKLCNFVTRLFVNRPFLPSLILVTGQDRLRLLALIANIRLGWKGLPKTTTLACQSGVNFTNIL
jgi:hypothetical protein